MCSYQCYYSPHTLPPRHTGYLPSSWEITGRCPRIGFIRGEFIYVGTVPMGCIYPLGQILQGEFYPQARSLRITPPQKGKIWCCNNCPRDRCPRRQLSKGILSNDTVVQGDYCPMRLLSKKAFTSKKLAQIDFSFLYIDTYDTSVLYSKKK